MLPSWGPTQRHIPLVEMRSSVGCWERCNPRRLSVGGVDAVCLREGEDLKWSFILTTAGTSLPTLGRMNNTAQEVCEGIDIFFQHEPTWVVHFHIKVTSQDLVFQEA